MTKSFKLLQDELHAKMTPEQLAKSDEIYKQMLAEINDNAFEPDLVDWLKAQNDDIKHYVNDMVRGVMNVQKQALKSAL